MIAGQSQRKILALELPFCRKTENLSFGGYPEVSIAKARQRREVARELLADGIDPGQAKREDKQAKLVASANTFEAIGRQWLTKTAATRSDSTQVKLLCFSKPAISREYPID